MDLALFRAGLSPNNIFPHPWLECAAGLCYTLTKTNFEGIAHPQPCKRKVSWTPPKEVEVPRDKKECYYTTFRSIASDANPDVKPDRPATPYYYKSCGYSTDTTDNTEHAVAPSIFGGGPSTPRNDNGLNGSIPPSRVERLSPKSDTVSTLQELYEYDDDSMFEMQFSPQAGLVPGLAQMPSNTNTTSQNVTFNDQMEAYVQVVEGATDPTRTLCDDQDLPLSSFFSRPVKIHEQQWDTGSIIEFNINPWGLFFDNPRVVNRISNYKLLRSKLHIKVVINGNGFHYGRAIVAYQPLAAFDGLSEFSLGADNVQLSQLPHIFLNPTNSTGGEIECPFFYNTNYLDVPSAAWNNMGMLRCRTLNSLKHANGATDKVTVSVFAWAEDVKLSVLTSVEPSTIAPQGNSRPSSTGFRPQSGEEIDEANSKGVVSGPATTLAKLSNAAAAIPQIRPFAMATSQLASATAGMAKALGYSRPPVTKNPDPYRPTLASQLATTTTPDSAIKMTVDDKQELTIDPRIAGITGDDTLSIKSLAKRESFLVSFPWGIGDPPETLLWNSRITPVTWREGGTAPTNFFRFPACAFAAMPFTYWTGTMNFRFQVVASSFHKGRLKITYDPDHVAAEEYNTNHTQIIDIADKQDFTISIGNGQITTLLDHAYPGITPESEVHSTTRLATDEHGNGVIAISVLNELTSPDSVSNNDIELNVYVSMGDDFEVFVPDNHFQSFVFKPYITVGGMTPQSGEEVVPDSFGDEQLDAPTQMTSERVGPSDQDLSLVNKVFTGESICSFRQLLKRYNLHRRQSYGPPGSTAEAREIYLSQNIYPYLRGQVAGAIDETVASIPYSYCNTILLHWVTAAFAGWRGSIRTKLHHTNTIASSETYNAKGFTPRTLVERNHFLFDATQYSLVLDPQATYADGDISYGIIKSQANEILNRYVPTGVQGAVLADASINPVVEFEMPFYSRFRFEAGKPYNVTDGNLFTEGWNAYMQMPVGNSTFTDMYYATGEDYQVYFYTGLPRMYYEADAPAPLIPVSVDRPKPSEPSGEKVAPEKGTSFFKKII